MILTYLKNIIVETRPRQWIKNLTIFAFLVFSKELFISHQFITVCYSFLSFTLLTSAIYFFNDVIDYDKDKNNPEKKLRPIASGKISRKAGIIICICFVLANIITAYLLSAYFLLMCLIYLVTMILYSLYFKDLVIIDAIIIAGGFVIRVLAGGFVIGLGNIYSWIIIVTISLALLLAFGKRRSEITLLGDNSQAQRKVLVKYPVDLLNSLISGLFATTFLSYILLTFDTGLSPARNILQESFIKLPDTVLRSPHLLKVTIPIVFYGLARYLYIIYTKKYSGTPEKALFSDIILLITVFIWIISVTFLLYAGQ